MELIFFVAILISAFSHALYNFLMHKSGGSRLFLLLMFLIAASISTVYYILSPSVLDIPWQVILIIYSASFFYVAYQIFVSKAYQFGEISKLYPLTVLSPILVPIWAVLFLHEQVNSGIIIGILISTCGAIMMKQNTLRLKELRHLFSVQGTYRGAGFAIMASVVYSVGSVFDKSKIGSYELIPYLWILLCCMALNMLLYTILFERNTFYKTTRINPLYLLLAGIAAYVSFYTFRMALQHVDVSVAVPIRTSSIIFALLLGIFFVKEKMTLNKLAGVITIISGIIIINYAA